MYKFLTILGFLVSLGATKQPLKFMQKSTTPLAADMDDVDFED